MIAGFEEVTAGSITLVGRRIQRLAPAKRNVAMAFEGYSLYPPLTVRDNIAFALKSSAMPSAKIKSAVQEVAALLEIEFDPGSLSLVDLRRPTAAREPRARPGAKRRPLFARRADGAVGAAVARGAARPSEEFCWWSGE